MTQDNLLTASEVYEKEVKCKCGHLAKHHHLSMALGSDEYDYVVGECEYHGSNEYGGRQPSGEWHTINNREIYLVPVQKFEGWLLPLSWEKHCMSFSRDEES